MSLLHPLALLLIAPLAALAVLAGRQGLAGARLPGAWARVVAPALRPVIAAQAGLAGPAAPYAAVATGALIALALARPGLDIRPPTDYASLAGRVVVLDVGADLARHRQMLDALRRADPNVATAVVAVGGDAYRITPFTTDAAQIDRYVRVLRADMMPRPGHRPHLGLARAERMLDRAGYLVRQVVLLSANAPPRTVVEAPRAGSQRIVVSLDPAHDWSDWAKAQGAASAARNSATAITRDLSQRARRAARDSLPDARAEISAWLIAAAAALWLLRFRRRAG